VFHGPQNSLPPPAPFPYLPLTLGLLDQKGGSLLKTEKGYDVLNSCWNTPASLKLETHFFHSSLLQ